MKQHSLLTGQRERKRKENCLCRRLPLFPPLLDALQQILPILVQLQLRDDNLGRVDANGHALAIRLLPDKALNVHDPLQTVDARDLALTALVRTPDDRHLVILADGDRANLLW